MPKFNKAEAGLVTRLDKWLYLLKNLNKFEEIPLILKEQPFEKLFHLAMISNLTEEEMKMYDESLKRKRDWQSALNTKLVEGEEKGMKKGIEKVAKKMKEKGLHIEVIAEMTGLSIEEINEL